MRTLKTKSSRISTPAPRQALRPLRVLAVLDGTAQTNRILRYLVDLSAGAKAFEVVVLNVQERRTDARLRGYETFKQTDVDDRLRNDISAPIVSSAARWLGKANISVETAVEIGDPLEAILATASAKRCTMIVVGAASSGGLARWLATAAGLVISRSMAARLLASSPIPVAIVK